MVGFAYISGGKLFVQLAGEEARELESPFAASVVKRAASIARRNEWKSKGRGARFMMGLEGLSEQLDDDRPAAAVRFTGLCRGRHPAELCYTLASGRVTGLFTFSGGEEQRLFHGTDVSVSEPAAEPRSERIACVMSGKGGQSHIAVIGSDGQGLQQVTAGDAMDSGPSWAADGSRIVFESRAFGYDRAGQVVDIAPATIQELHLEAGEVKPRVEKPGMSCSDPRVASDGTLYYLRRPAPRREPISILRLALDVLLFPWRILVALVQYLNVFALRYTGKPLVTAGSARAKRADVKRAAMIGNLAKAAESADDDDKKLPDDWQLLAVGSDGSEEVVAKGVLCFDLCGDGSVIWSNGRAVNMRRDGRDTTLASRLELTHLIALDPPEES